VLFVNMK